ncbi:MAG: DUF5682 family protein [Limnohabitans sp.]|nr:DUF5682 family protein [Limnohabitans sp.]
MIKDVPIFGVRHLSPAASLGVLEFLNQHQPKVVLIEGPSDCSQLMDLMVAKEVKLPIALLAYTTELPIETVIYPFAEYSPEYQAICWAKKNKVKVEFIDLPTYNMLKLKQKNELTDKASSFYQLQNEWYQTVTQLSDETQYESYWERHFEHHPKAFREAILHHSSEMRLQAEPEEYEAVPDEYAYNWLRESYMKRKIQQTLDAGISAKDIVVIVGAYHVLGIQSDLKPMDDEAVKLMPKTNALYTLMPYSYYRMSSRTGYGAGNKAPNYFDLMWQHYNQNSIDKLSADYLSQIAQELRKTGFNASTASVIEATRMAQALTSLREGYLPVLEDLHDAVVTCFGGGELAGVATAINTIDIGNKIGFLPEGISQTPIQQDVYQELKKLKLESYRTEVPQEIALDLRENIQVKSKVAAFIDLNRSTFFHRLELLGIEFVQKVAHQQAKANWAEKWILRWSPEIEIQMVETNLKGETIEIATAYELTERLQNTTDIDQVATIIKWACVCQLTTIFTNAISILQAQLVECNDFTKVAHAAREIAILLEFEGIRQIDLEPLTPIFQQLFLRSTLLVVDSCQCDDKAATKVLEGIQDMEYMAQQFDEILPVTIWHKEIETVAQRDDLNTKLSGNAFAILLERNIITDDQCTIEVSRRLSPGIPADLGAGWFEGLSQRNRYALLSRTIIWRELDNYINQLEDNEFMRSLVFLRRAFSDFEPQQKNSIAELLSSMWGMETETVAEFLHNELTEEEEQKLDDLNNFDFEF